MFPQSIESAVLNLGNENDTVNLAHALVSLLKRCHIYLRDEYLQTSKKKRTSYGKYELQLFYCLAYISRWTERKDVCKQCSWIMNALGYESYSINEERYKQKVENEKKSFRKNGVNLEDTTIILNIIAQSLARLPLSQLDNTMNNVQYSRLQQEEDSLPLPLPEYCDESLCLKQLEIQLIENNKGSDCMFYDSSHGESTFSASFDNDLFIH